MKKIILITLAIFAGVSFAAAQKKAEVKEKPQSVLEWINPNADLGEVPLRVPATATYEFVNKGDKPVIITNVRTSCGCTSKSYSKEPIQPGKKGKVQATYNAARLGKFTKTVTVTTNEEGVAPKRLKISGVVVEKQKATAQK